jgi:DUF1680 family protein
MNNRPSAESFRTVDTRKIQVGGWIGERIKRTCENNLLQLDWDNDFLKPFREKLWGALGEYVGLGKSFEAVVRLAAHTSDPELLRLSAHLRESILSVQEEDGYLGTYCREKRTVSIWDVHELAYVFQALVVDWEFFADERSLSAAKKLADYLLQQLSGVALETIGESASAFGEGTINPDLAIIGLDLSLLSLYRKTNDRRYLDFCVEKLNLAGWNLPIVEGRHARVEGHAYCYLSHCLAQIELESLSGESVSPKQLDNALNYLRKGGGLVVSGTCSRSESWHSDQDGTGELGETCATSYLIRLCGRLLRRDGLAEYGDLMERAIYNALFAAQSPDSRRIRYYTPFEGKRIFWDMDTYCCPGNFRRIIAELPELLYFASESEIVVNLYSDSEAVISLGNLGEVRIRQETDYPNSGNIRIHVTPATPGRFRLKCRIPAWCESFHLAINGEQISCAAEDGWLTIERIWDCENVVDLFLEMPWRLVRGTAKQSGKAAILRGPVLFCLNPARNPTAAANGCLLEGANTLGLEPDSTLRAEGVRCLVEGTTNESILLSEFIDPDGEATYFPVGNTAALTDDELLSRPPISSTE